MEGKTNTQVDQLCRIHVEYSERKLFGHVLVKYENGKVVLVEKAVKEKLSE